MKVCICSILMIFGVLACKKTAAPLVVKTPYVPFYYKYAGTYAGIRTDYNFMTGKNTDFADTVYLTLRKTTKGDTLNLLLNQMPVYFVTQSKGYWYPWDQSDFGFSFVGKDTQFWYDYNGGPGINTYLLKTFIGKKIK